MLKYATYLSILRRCYDTECKAYQTYHARGVTVAEEWLHAVDGYKKFAAHLGPKPSSLHSVDRVDNNRGYEPGNVRWATMKEQMRNTSVNRIIEAFGKKQCVADWAEEFKMVEQVLRGRLWKGWSPELALTIPVGDSKYSQPHFINLDGMEEHLHVVAKRYNISPNTLKSRLAKGIDTATAIAMVARECRSIHITAFGQTKALIVFAKEYGINYRRLYERITVEGLSPEIALTQAVKHKSAKPFLAFGEMRTINAWCKLYNQPRGVITKRLKDGMALEEALLLKRPAAASEVIDVNGVVDTIANHCRTYGVDRKMVAKRMKRGWDIVKAITTKSDPRFNTSTKSAEKRNASSKSVVVTIFEQS